MDTDEIFLSMIEDVTLTVPERFGDDPEARHRNSSYELFEIRANVTFAVPSASYSDMRDSTTAALSHGAS